MIGTSILYKLTQQDVEEIVKSRKNSYTNGNDVVAGQVFPGIIVKSNSEHNANLKIFLDGEDCYWATSRYEGDGLGQWRH